jgi:hypothetical protein
MCIGVIDKLPDGETGLVNGLNGSLFHNVDVGSKAWVKRGKVRLGRSVRMGRSLWRLLVMGLGGGGGAC